MAKRKAATEAIPKEKPSKRVSHPHFLLAPSAGGVSPKDVIDSLVEIGTVHQLEGGWGNKIYNSTKNVDKVLSLMEKVSKNMEKGSTLWLCGTSFGCRVLSEIVTYHESEIPTNVAKSLLLIGYPLYGPKNSNERVASLNNIPVSIRVTFISGEKDEFIARSYLKKKGGVLLRSIAKDMSAHSTVEVIEGGKHNPLAVTPHSLLFFVALL
mmetsp:Transcript_6789/g.8750  ORF Transcript_6789/g.8750 Transcript_6789/m.8750 type:complete len:210 (-) Transcript_6789:168-797(-)